VRSLLALVVMPTLDGPCDALRREAWNRESDKSGADPAEHDCQAAGWPSREADERIDADGTTSEPDRRSSEPEQQREFDARMNSEKSFVSMVPASPTSA
jgi:hypothetical protein